MSMFKVLSLSKCANSSDCTVGIKTEERSGVLEFFAKKSLAFGFNFNVQKHKRWCSKQSCSDAAALVPRRP